MAEFVESFDGTRLAIHRLGLGRPVLLLHGLFSNADMNWIRFGHAQTLADAGFAAIMPDLRAHGESDKPQHRAAYGKDVLARDVASVVAGLGLQPGGFDLAGFSLGARTALRAVLCGVAPRRLILAGMGLEGLSDWPARARFFIDAIDRFDHVKQGDPAYFAVQFMKTMKVDRVAARLLLQSVDHNDAGELGQIGLPVLVVCGQQDRDNGSPAALAEALPDGRLVEIPGTHMSSVTGPELGQAMAGFLSA